MLAALGKRGETAPGLVSLDISGNGLTHAVAEDLGGPRRRPRALGYSSPMAGPLERPAW